MGAMRPGSSSQCQDSQGDGREMVDGAMNSFDSERTRNAFQELAWELARPSRVMRPRVYPTDQGWCALYGESPQEGVAGFGDTPEAACLEFDKQWNGG